MIRCERRRKATDAAQQLSRARHDGVQQRTFRCHGLLTGARNILRASDGLLRSSALVAVQFACLRWEFILHVDRLFHKLLPLNNLERSAAGPAGQRHDFRSRQAHCRTAPSQSKTESSCSTARSTPNTTKINCSLPARVHGFNYCRTGPSSVVLRAMSI